MSARKKKAKKRRRIVVDLEAFRSAQANLEKVADMPAFFDETQDVLRIALAARTLLQVASAPAYEIARSLAWRPQQ